MIFARYRLKALLNRLRGKRSGDDFCWEDYNLRYRAELAWNEKHYAQRLLPGDCEFDRTNLNKRSAGLHLHENSRLLYETILQLRPRS